MAQPDFYHLEVKSENVKFTCFLNGIPLYTNKDILDASASIPIQMFMTGKDNELRVEAVTIADDETGSIMVNIVPFAKGEFADTEKYTPGIAELKINATNEPTSESIKFDNEGHDYSYIFKEGKELEEKEVLEYGNELYKFIQNADAEGFVNEMEPYIKDYSAAYGYTAQQLKEGLAQQLSGAFFSAKQPTLESSRLSAKSYSNNRVWELLIDGEEFLKKKEEGGSSQMPVYVAKINGELSIVR
ncbi:MAG: hypothetical protein ACNS60_20335 [Candidatus Cyclobacteriaceae bacterium M2_1C_046]